MESLIQRREGSVCILTLVRPPVNALDQGTLDELAAAMEELETDREVRVVVITGGIEGIFCSGGDLRYWCHIDDGREVSLAGRKVFSRIERLPKPTIAAINGHVIGDGLSLALACDIRIASEAASFRLPEVSYGFIPGWGLIHRLVAQVGRANASDFLLSGRFIDASRAQSTGLIHDMIEKDLLMEEVLRRARSMAVHSPSALRTAKCALLGGDEGACFEAAWGKPDWREGIAALLAKRKPVFGPDERAGECCCVL